MIKRGIRGPLGFPKEVGAAPGHDGRLLKALRASHGSSLGSTGGDGCDSRKVRCPHRGGRHHGGDPRPRTLGLRSARRRARQGKRPAVGGVSGQQRHDPRGVRRQTGHGEGAFLRPGEQALSGTTRDVGLYPTSLGLLRVRLQRGGLPPPREIERAGGEKRRAGTGHRVGGRPPPSRTPGIAAHRRRAPRPHGKRGKQLRGGARLSGQRATERGGALSRHRGEACPPRRRGRRGPRGRDLPGDLSGSGDR
ncbi:MAG: hypothetical protein BWY88_00057 [Synergistetes bacterium ADurb.Bin520]|nr:MAG: hypothetical protein BWY88_00057 [Synergistetes bacterium ADurb.Bin520]